MDYGSLAIGFAVGGIVCSVAAVVIMLPFTTPASTTPEDNGLECMANARRVQHFRDSLTKIAKNETKGGNATVKRMALLARTALVTDDLQVGADAARKTHGGAPTRYYF